MRLLHTSDWHLGRALHGVDRLPEQEEVLTGLATLVRERGVDVVLVAGDVFDRALPNAETVLVYDRVLGALHDAGVRIVISSGNHDSAARLGTAARFTAAGGLHLHTDVGRCAQPTLLADEHGPVAVYGLPYLEPETAGGPLGVPPGAGHAGVLGAAMSAVRADLATQPPGTRSVVLAHAFVLPPAKREAAAETSASERSLGVGGVQIAPSPVFDGVDYVALGHLHGCQQPDPGRPGLRYSGSPLAFSFSELRQRKSVLLVDLDATGLAAVERVELPVPRRLAEVTGRLADLLSDPVYDEHAADYLSVTLTDRTRPQDPMRLLQLRFPHAVAVTWRPLDADPSPRLAPATRRAGGDLEVAADFVEWVRATRPSAAEIELFRAAFGVADHRAAAG